MPSIASLVKDTSVYGLSSIVGKFLNWMLVPLYTRMFDTAQNGQVTYMYSVVALAMVILTYGLETGFFRFANHERYGSDPGRVYTTGLVSLAGSSTLFLAAVLLALPDVSSWMGFADRHTFVVLMAVTVSLDAFTALPFSYLRFRRRPWRFAALKLTGIGINIGLNLFWILLCPWLDRQAPGCVSWIWHPAFGIGYIFLANLVSSAAVLLLLIPEVAGLRWRFDGVLWRKMLAYSWPLLVLGIAGIMNQTLDKILFPLLYPDKGTMMSQLGIYGACQKIAVVMIMFIQAWRFAFEPFIFASHRNPEGGADRTAYAHAMRFYVIFSMVIFMAVVVYMPVIKHFVAPAFYSGLYVVPVVMMAEFLFGIFFNLSVWYKVTDRTLAGMSLSLAGLVVTVLLNIALVPRIGYLGCACASLLCYGTMALASWWWGRRVFPVDYRFGRLALYVAAALLLLALRTLLDADSALIDMAFGTLLIIAYIAAAIRLEGISLKSLLKRR